MKNYSIFRVLDYYSIFDCDCNILFYFRYKQLKNTQFFCTDNDNF